MTDIIPNYWDLDPALRREKNRKKKRGEQRTDAEIAKQRRQVEALYGGLEASTYSETGDGKNESEQRVNNVYGDFSDFSQPAGEKAEFDNVLPDNEATKQPDVDDEPNHTLNPHQTNAGNVLKALDDNAVATLRESGGGTVGAKDNIYSLTDALSHGLTCQKIRNQRRKAATAVERKLNAFNPSYNRHNDRTRRVIEERTAAASIEAGLEERSNQGDQLNTETPRGDILDTAQANELNRAVVAVEFLRGVQTNEIDISHLSLQEQAWVNGFMDEQLGGFGIDDKSNEELAVLGEFLERIGYAPSQEGSSQPAMAGASDNTVERNQQFASTTETSEKSSNIAENSAGIFNLGPNTTVRYCYPRRRTKAKVPRRDDFGLAA